MIPPRYYLLLHLIILAWSLTAILGKLITLSSVDLVVWRTGLSALVFGVIAKVSGVRFWIGGKDLLGLLLLGAIIGWHWLLFFLSAKLSTASVCLAAMPTMMIFCSLIEPLVTGSRHWKKGELLLGAIICAAVWMIYEVELRYWLGFTVGLVAAVLAACFSVGNKLISHRYHYTVQMGWQMIGGCLGCLAVRPFFGLPVVPPVPSGNDLWWLLLLSGVCTVFAYAGFALVLRHLSVFSINVAYNLEPVYGIILAASIFGESERMSPGFYLAAGIIVAAVVIHPLWQRRTERLRRG